MQIMDTYINLLDSISSQKAVLFYFSFPTCGVCKSIQPKIIRLVQEHFPLMPMYYVDIEKIPEASGQLSVYAVPAILVYFEGKELIREARNFGIDELGAKIDRYYSMLFDEESD